MCGREESSPQHQRRLLYALFGLQRDVCTRHIDTSIYTEVGFKDETGQIPMTHLCSLEQGQI
eukprot:1152493-Pelagomonas_calceolata.AAC.2